MANASSYNVELRDKAGYLRQYLTPFVPDISWEWNRIGGCGRARMTAQMEYRKIEFSARDDVQIRIRDKDYDLNTKLLIDFDGVDGATSHTAKTGQAVTFVGNAQLNVEHAKFGTGCLKLGENIVNGNFEVWSGGASAAPDGWTLYGAGASITRESSIVKLATYSCKVTNANGVTAYPAQQIDVSKSIAYWRGKTVTVDCWVWADTANRVRLSIGDGVGGANSSYHTGDSTYQKLSVTYTVNASATALYVYPEIIAGSVISAYFDGVSLIDNSTDYVTLPDSDNCDLSSVDGAIDMQIYPTALPAVTCRLIGQSTGVDGNWILYINSDGTIAIGLNGISEIASSAGVISTGSWQHVSVVKNGSTVTIRVNGISVASGTTTVFNNSSNSLYIGGDTVAGHYFNGYIDELRISKGITSDFNPPNQPYKYASEPSKLVYRGWVDGVTSSLKNPQEITFDVNGYFSLLDFLVVHDNGSKMVYSNMTVSDIVIAILDTFVTTNSPITKGTIDGAKFFVDTIEFKCSVAEALKTLAELEGEVEYGVDEDLNFFWYAQGTSLTHKFIVGNNVQSLDRTTKCSNLVNKIYFEGGDVDGVTYKKIAEVSDSKDMYFPAESIESNSSIITSSVADQYLSSKLKENSAPKPALRFKVPNTTLRLEDTLPIGEIAVYDKDYDDSMYVVGEALDSHVVLLVQGYGADGEVNIPEALDKVVTVHNHAKISTAQYVFPPSSIELDGVDDYLTLPASADYDFGAGDFEIGGRFRWNDTDGLQLLVSRYVDDNNYWYLFKDVYNKLNLIFVIGGVIKGYYYTTVAPTINEGIWYDITAVRNGATAKIMLNGISLALTESTAFGANDVGSLASPLYIGCSGGAWYFFNGYIDEVYILKGHALHTADYTPRTRRHNECDIKVGLKADGGSNARIGGVYRDQVDRIAYTLSNTEERFNIEVTMGESVSETTAKLKQLELLLSNIRQNQG